MLEILFGFIAGNITGLGMGGGTILILLLSLFMNLDQHIAQATNLVFFIPTSIAGIVTNIKYKNVDKDLSKIIITYGIIGSVIGAIISQKISSEKLKEIFAIFILLIVLHELYEFYKEYIKKKKTYNNKKGREE